MENELVERVADAILAQRYRNDGGRFATHREHDLALARAAIAELKLDFEAVFRGGFAEGRYGTHLTAAEAFAALRQLGRQLSAMEEPA